MDTTCSLLLSVNVPSSFWGEAVLTAVHIINRVPSSIHNGFTPFQMLYDLKPEFDSLRVFGCTCFVLLPASSRTKLSARSCMCVFLGYVSNNKGVDIMILCQTNYTSLVMLSS